MRKTSNASGIAAMLAATAFFVVCDTFMKLVMEDLPPFEVLFLRGIAASLACAILLVLLSSLPSGQDPPTFATVHSVRGQSVERL